MIRKIASYVLLTVIAVSSGLLQFGFHLCHEDGLHLFDHNCKNKEKSFSISHNSEPSTKAIKRCCSRFQKKNVEAQSTPIDGEVAEDCCTEDFIYFVNPFPHKLMTLQINGSANSNPVDFCGVMSTSIVDANADKVSHYCKRDSIPILGINSNDYCRFLVVWRI